MAGEDKQTGQRVLSEELERTRTGREQQSRPDGRTRGLLPHSRAEEDQVRVELKKKKKNWPKGSRQVEEEHTQTRQDMTTPLALIPVTGATAQMNSCVPE